MRYRWLSLLALLGAPSLVVGQSPQQPSPAQLDPANKLDAILIQWEQAMSSIKTLHTVVSRKSVDKQFAVEEVCQGEAKYLKPNKASIWLRNVKKQDEFERMLCNGQLVYKWEPKLKEIQLYELEKPKQGQVNDENFVQFLFGMKAGQAKARYQMAFSNEDQFYFYIDVFPKAPSDKVEFTRARLVLIKTSGLPRQIWFEQPNQNEITWDFSKMATNIDIDPREFDPPAAPPGWQLKRAAPGTPPGVGPGGSK
jgi:TIGR03009 family protein